jgi:acyl-ACP thioesterase
VRAAEIDVALPIRVGSDLVGTTRVVGSRRVWARRRTDFRTTDGDLAADVRIDWLLLDRRGIPTRIPPEFEPIFGMHQEPVELGRVALPDAPDDARTISVTVRPQELDPMDHVNNAVYLDWLEEAVLAAAARTGAAANLDAVPRRYRLEYAAAADAGMVLSDAAWPDPDGGWRYRVTRADGPELFRAAIDASGGAP